MVIAFCTISTLGVLILFLCDLKLAKDKGYQLFVNGWLVAWLAFIATIILQTHNTFRQAADAEQSRKKLGAVIDRYTAEIRTLNKDLSESSQEVQTLSRDATGLRTDLRDRDRSIANRDETIVSLRTNLDSASNSIVWLNNPDNLRVLLGQWGLNEYKLRDYEASARLLEMCFYIEARKSYDTSQKRSLSVIYAADCYMMNRTEIGKKQFQKALDDLTESNVSRDGDLRSEDYCLTIIKEDFTTNECPFVLENYNRVRDYVKRLNNH
jgi:hypothetical protein